MSVNAKTVKGRRELHFSRLEEIARDAGSLVENPGTKTLGNWPLSRIMAHLTFAINGSMDGNLPKAPWIARLIGPFVKKRFLKNPMNSGFNLPGDAEPVFFPDDGSAMEALTKLEQAIRRTQSTQMNIPHPVFGRMNHDEWTQLHMRHAEMHLSFAVPG